MMVNHCQHCFLLFLFWGDGHDYGRVFAFVICASVHCTPAAHTDRPKIARMRTSKLLPPAVATRSQISFSEKGKTCMTEEASPGAQMSTPSDAMHMPLYFWAPSPTPSMKLMVWLLGSTTSTAVALKGAQYSRPSGPAQMPEYFNSPSPRLR